ncbi:carotenoid 1,2-hydratase [Palleronia sediminis]|uniref:Carotenoid 1,2-hydratase n=1 Tax=Palleronia sediminis TaxID=2547833 RepID=A0A4R6ACU9_9RHOB|nr:carotenoid 1,2-hydratase [Palleronia sediminis]
MIGFIGSVFSPWYRWSGRRDPENNCCMNVATYGAGGGVFAMTDRGRDALRTENDKLTIGPSTMTWHGDRLIVEFDERGAPPRLGRVRGRVIVTPAAITGVELPLSAGGEHVWRPFAPVSRIRVEIEGQPAWEGEGYFDSNFGTSALEADFSRWTWGRFPTPEGAACFYDARMRDGSTRDAGFLFHHDGRVEVLDLPKLSISRTFWQLSRETRGDPGTKPQQVLGMLDAPFYARAAVETTVRGHRSTGVHEVLDCDRLRGPWLMPLVAMRVPRRARWP